MFYQTKISSITREDHVWCLFIDGAFNGEGPGAGLRLINSEGHEFMYAIRLNFKSTNNEAEYEALLAGLRITKKLGVRHLEASINSMLIAGKINGSYEAKNEAIASYLFQEKNLYFNLYLVK
ncbi:uncharacterized protein LOC143588740 [Bidens hawaiensis]|uniref:uncharacterized protein LOC143588740 n=1 Tax=Bidens hawaiensis TaxID=980011 RepID=UPI004049D094